MAFNILYKNQDGSSTKISIFKGLVGALAEVHEFCGTDNPMKIKYKTKDKYDAFLASEIEINILIQNEEDAAALEEILTGGYYVEVWRNETGSYAPFWMGKLTSRFYTEAYAQYPYAIRLNGSDQLGAFDKWQPLMIDFPEPDSKVSLIDLFTTFLMDESMYPDKYAGNKVEELMFSDRLYYIQSSRWIEQVYLDPLNWMDDKDQYKSKKDILSDILQALGARILQWNYKWWIVGYDTQWDAGYIRGDRYLLNSATSWTYSEWFEIEPDLQTPYESKLEARQVHNNAIMKYEPCWRKLVQNINYNENQENISGFTNVSGNFYTGHDGVYLEFDGDGNLQHWEGPNVVKPLANNDGFALVTKGSAPNMEYIDSPIVANNYYRMIISVNISDLSSDTHLFMEVSIDMNGDKRYLYNDGGLIEEFTWGADNARIGLKNGSHNIEVELPYVISVDATLRVGLQSSPSIYEPIINELKVNFTNLDYSNTKYKQEITTDINPFDSDLTNYNQEWNWGTWHNDLPNDNIFHRSSAYDSNGDPIQLFAWYGQAERLIDLISLIKYSDNLTYTPTLSVTYKGLISPFTIIKDAEGRYYRFVQGEYNDIVSEWKIDYTQFKLIKNVPTDIPEKCDYSPFDYNDDYCKTIPSTYDTQAFNLISGDVAPNAGYLLQSSVGSIARTTYNGLVIYDMISFGANWFRFNLGVAGEELLPDTASITIDIPSLSMSGTLLPSAGYSYGGNISGIQAALIANIGVSIIVNITANKL